MQHIAQQTTRPASTSSNHVVSALVILALMSGWAIFFYLGIGSLVSTDTSPEPIVVQPDRDNTVPIESTTVAETPTVKYADAEQEFVLSLQRNELRSRVEKTRSSFRHTQSMTEHLQARLAALQNDDSGRRLATPVTARKILFLASFPNQPDFVAIQRDLTNAERFIDVSRQPNPNFDQIVAKLVVAEIELEANERWIGAVSRAIDELLRSNTVTQPNTLAEAIRQLQHSDVEQITVQADARLADHRTVLASQVDNAIKRRDTLKEELEKAKIQYDAVRQQSSKMIEASQRSMQESQKTQSDQKAKAITAMQRAYPAVRELLTPFTTPGYRQPGPSGRLEATSNNRPLSYSGLLRMRALEDSKEGRKILFYAMQPSNALGKLNDRPLGDFPRNANFSDIDNAEVQEKLKRVQSFLRDHGEAMVSTGTLSP